jgi:hypothetical protein
MCAVIYEFLLILPSSCVFQWSHHNQFTVTLCWLINDISNRPKLEIAMSGLINITNIAVYQYKTTFDIISVKAYKEMTNKYIFTILNIQHYKNAHTTAIYLDTTHSQVTCAVLSQSVGANVKR